MKMRLCLMLLSVFCLPFFVNAADRGVSKEDVYDTIASFKRADPGLAKVFTNAVGYAVFPEVGKGGFIVAGGKGKGLVYEHGKLIGTASISQLTVGAQIGGQVYSEVIFFETKAALDQFKKSRTEMSAQISAVAAAEGSSRNARYIDGVMIFTKPKKGLMAEVSVGGQKFRFEPLHDPKTVY